jgi:hypothetical protein
MAGITRLVRRICLLREQGDAAQAAHLQDDELAAAVRDLRLAHGPEAFAESELHGLFATEGRHVAEAVILSELLLPRLVECRPAAAAPRSSGPARTFSPPPSAARAPVSAAGSPAIPDLLDAMLAAERHGRRPAPANSRES